MIRFSIGPYEISSSLGEGGMGAVYRARDAKLNREVALKVLLPDVAGDPERLARFRREAQVLASLNHPHIGAIHGLVIAQKEVCDAEELRVREPLGDAAHGCEIFRRGRDEGLVRTARKQQQVAREAQQIAVEHAEAADTGRDGRTTTR